MGTKKGHTPVHRHWYNGFECYARTTDTRIILRNLGRVPAFPGRPTIPAELAWPVPRDWEAIEGFINAITYCETGKLEEIKKQWPKFDFKVDDFINSVKISGLIKDQPQLDGLEEAALLQMATMVEVQRQTIWSGDVDGLNATFDVVIWKYPEGKAPEGVNPKKTRNTLELTLFLPGQDRTGSDRIPLPGPTRTGSSQVDQDRTVFTKISLRTRKGRVHHTILEHHPGLYHAYDLDKNLYLTLLKPRTMGLLPPKRTKPTLTPSEPPSPAPAPAAPEEPPSPNQAPAAPALAKPPQTG